MEIHSKDAFIQELTNRTGQDPALCYQCGKCSAGCPVRDLTDYSPNKIIRFLQLGMYEEVLTSKTIWACAGCLTCSARCPQEYNLASTMDALRQMAIEKGCAAADKKSIAFHESFLDQIKHFGRTYEMGLLIEYKIKTKQFFQDMNLAPAMLSRGKLSLLPHKIKNTKEMKRIFERAEQIEDKDVISPNRSQI